METLRSEFPKYNGLFVQCEDELSAVSMALGFSYAGHLAITGSSGPASPQDRGHRLGDDGGDSLIIVNVQRGGPSTGSPPTSSRAISTRPSLAATATAPRRPRSSTVEDCFTSPSSRPHRPQVQHPGLHPQRRIARDPHPGLRRADLKSLMVDPTPDLSPRRQLQAYPLDGITRHAPPGTRMLGAGTPSSRLEHDEMGHPPAVLLFTQP